MNTFWGREGEGDKIYVYNLRTGAIQFFFGVFRVLLATTQYA